MMRSFALSKRDNFVIIKEAGGVEDFLSGAAKSITGKLQLRTKPFETLFALFGPFMFGGLIMTPLLLIAESYGYGLGNIGAMIDKMLGFGDPQNPPQLGEGDIKQASENITDTLLGKLSSAVGLSSTASQEFQLSKRAYRGRAARSFLKKILRGKRLSVVNVFYGVLIMLAKSLMYYGIIGGAKEAIEKKYVAPEGGSTVGKVPRWKTYANKSKDVERSLIRYIDAAIEKIRGFDFSDHFEMTRGYSLQGSPEMKQVLEGIVMANGGVPINELNTLDTFLGPPLIQMAKILMPRMTYERIDKPKKSKKPGDKERLVELVKGVL